MSSIIGAGEINDECDDHLANERVQIFIDFRNPSTLVPSQLVARLSIQVKDAILVQIDCALSGVSFTQGYFSSLGRLVRSIVFLVALGGQCPISNAARPSWYLSLRMIKPLRVRDFQERL